MSTHESYVVVVGIDYSDLGELALERALPMAAARPSTEIHVVHAVSSLVPPHVHPDADSLQEASLKLRTYFEERLSAFVAKRGSLEAWAPRFISHVRVDAPAEQIAQLAADLEADLVIVGTHGRRGLARVTMGSVAESVVRLAPCPVLVVRPKSIPEIPRIEPACGECLTARRESGGAQFWCAQHSERHGRRHTYHQPDRIARDGSMPLTFR